MFADIPTISIIYAAGFAIAAICALIVALSSRLTRNRRIVAILFIILIAGASFYFAGRSGLSPFSFSGKQAFGATGDVVNTVVGIVGAVLGIVGSYFFRVDPRKIDYRDLLKPLSFCPMTLIPVIKMIEAAKDTTLLGYLLLFCLAYQTGFFWERLLKTDGPS